MARKGRRRGKIRIKKSVQLKHRNDATRVAKPDTALYPRIEGRPPANNGATFKIRVRRR